MFGGLVGAGNISGKSVCEGSKWSCFFCVSLFYLILTQGASKTGTAPDGSTYVEAAEKEEIKKMLR